MRKFPKKISISLSALFTVDFFTACSSAAGPAGSERSVPQSRPATSDDAVSSGTEAVTSAHSAVDFDH